MTPARANQIRIARINGREPSNQAKREKARADQETDESRPTITRLWTVYLEAHPQLKGGRTERSRFQKYIGPTFGEKTPPEITAFEVDGLRVKLLKTLAPATVRNVLELLRRIVAFGQKKNLCMGLGFTIQMPKVDNLKTEFLNSEQLQALLKAIEEDDHPQAGPMMLLTLFSGLRRGEMFRLQWIDVDFEHGFLTLRDTKGGKTERVPMNDSAREVLNRQSRTEGSPICIPWQGRTATDRHQVGCQPDQKGSGPS